MGARSPAGQLVGGGADGVVGDGADLAEVLGDDQVRVQLGQQVDVQVVDGQGGPQQLPHRPVQDPAGAVGREPGAGQGRQPGHLWRVVALMGDSDQVLAGPRAQTISVAEGSSDTTRTVHPPDHRSDGSRPGRAEVTFLAVDRLCSGRLASGDPPTS